MREWMTAANRRAGGPSRVAAAMAAALMALTLGAAASAQEATPAPLLFGRTTVGGQANLVWQGYPSFPARYSGPLSLPTPSEFRNTRVFLLATNTRLWPAWKLEFDLEAANGRGLGGATGLAGITNNYVMRNLFPSLTPHVYVARLFVEGRVGRSTLRVGRLDLTAVFDNNSVLSGDRFLNWASSVNAAWDYAADTNGYTNAVEMELGFWKLAYALMPVEPNGMRLNWHSTQWVVERDFDWRRATIRALGFTTHATLGQFDQAGTDLGAVRRWRWKPGAELNSEYALGSDIHVGARLGTQDDALEEYAYTECENTASIGLDWVRDVNRLGLALTSNGLSAAHAAYLRRGGQDFMLGDGHLAYGREGIAEAYWSHRFSSHLRWGPDVQYIQNPGYNRARGPIWVGGLRVHAGF